jgi:hypothetical protein
MRNIENENIIRGREMLLLSTWPNYMAAHGYGHRQGDLDEAYKCTSGPLTGFRIRPRVSATFDLLSSPEERFNGGIPLPQRCSVRGEDGIGLLRRPYPQAEQLKPNSAPRFAKKQNRARSVSLTLHGGAK